MAGSQVAWGLDIGATSLKAVKLKRDGEKVAVEAFDVVEHDKFLTEPDVDRDAIIRTSLQKFIDRNNPRREALIMSVAGSKTFARFVKLPPVEPKKIPEIVKFEAIQQIPFPLEQVNWDYQTFANSDSPEVEVGIFAMKKDLVAQELSNFTALKMMVHGVQLAPLALYNAATFDEWTDGKGTVLVDIGAEHTDLVIVDAGRIWLRSINLGGNHFTEALAKAFKQPFSRAEQLKKSAATSKYQKQIFQAMRPIFADLVAEISRSLGHYQTSHRESHLERIVAMGNPFKLPNLQKYIQQELKMEVIRLESFKKGTVDPKIAAGLQENILSLGVAYGLALQGLDRVTIDTNLLPIEIARQMVWRRKQMWFAGAAAAIVVACGYWGYQAYAEAGDFDKTQTGEEYQKNVSERARIEREQKDFTATNSSFDESRKQVESLIQLASYRSLLPNVFDDIYGSLPQGKMGLPGGDYPQGHRFIVIQSLSPVYKVRVSDPIPSYADDEGAARPGAAALPGAMGAPRPGAPAAGPAAAASAVEPADRGFVVEVQGYTPCGAADPRENPVGLIDKFREVIASKAREADKTKAYYFTTTVYTRQGPIPAGTVFGDSKYPWLWGGAGKGAGGSGLYWPYFVPQMMGLSAQSAVPGMGMGIVPGTPVAGGMPQNPPFPIDAVIASEKRDPNRSSMINYLHFVFYVKVHLR